MVGDSDLALLESPPTAELCLWVVLLRLLDLSLLESPPTGALPLLWWCQVVLLRLSLLESPPTAGVAVVLPAPPGRKGEVGSLLESLPCLLALLLDLHPRRPGGPWAAIPVGPGKMATGIRFYNYRD